MLDTEQIILRGLIKALHPNQIVDVITSELRYEQYRELGRQLIEHGDAEEQKQNGEITDN